MPPTSVRILIIDDTPDEASVYSWYLAKLKDFKVSLDNADSGALGLKKLAVIHYNLVFLDYKMPGMDGLEVLNRINQSGFDVPVIMMTGGATERVAVEALKAGAIDYVLKEDLPKVDFSGLLRRVLEIARLKRENRELQRVTALKNEFLDLLTQDLKSPLVTIFGVVNMLSDERLGRISSDQKDAVDSILKEAERLYALAEDLGNLRALAVEATLLQRRQVSLKALVVELLAVMQRFWEEKGVKFETAIPEDSFEAECDRDKIVAVVENVLSNAVQFTPHGGTIGVLLRRVDGAVEIVVADTGAGMDAHTRAKLFDKFLQGEGKLSGRYRGLGLGLAISRKIAEAHGGALAVESPGPDKGTVVTLRLPVTAPAAAAEGNGASAGATAAAAHPSSAPA